MKWEVYAKMSALSDSYLVVMELDGAPGVSQYQAIIDNAQVVTSEKGGT